MKKLFTLLTAVLIVSMGFAQVAPTKRAIKDDGMTVKIGNPEMKAHNGAKDATSFWFSYAEDLENYWGEELEYFAPPTMCDSIGVYPYSDGNSPVQFFGMGHVHDFTYGDWVAFYEEMAGQGEQIPVIATSSSYSIDSVQLAVYYVRGTNMAATAVDTLIISYVINMDDESVASLSSSGNPAFKMYYVPYNEATHSAANVSSLKPSVTFNYATIVLDTILLTAEDEAPDSYFYIWTFPAPAGLNNITGKVNALAYSFVPGVARTTSSVITEDISSFRVICYKDPRAAYTTYGSDELMNDLNHGMLLDDYSLYNSNAFCYGAYDAGAVYTANLRPQIAFHVTCNDCSNVNVEDMEKENITVYPNPASSNLTVTLAGNEAATVQLFNLVGQQVYSETAVNSASINVSSLKAGVYMLKVSQNGKVYTSKVVVK
ncbi:MAG: T9SS type A sorting domain-containing protein [Bacteroidales bacterium]|nr:T9SS type A sorting domain-containing protein [Bacteroidales bacterium]